MKYQKKPVIVNCFQWTGDINQDEDPIWIRNAIGQGIVSFKDNGTPKVKLINNKRIDGVSNEGLLIDTDSITTNLFLKSSFLKDMRGKNIKIIYMDADVTSVTKMKIDKITTLPRTIGGNNMPLVPIKFYGTPKTTYTD